MNACDVFVGRKIEIDAIERHLTQLTADAPHDLPRVAVLYGKGGIGKTKLATELVNRLSASEIITTSVIDLRESANRTLLSLLRTIALQIGASLFKEFLGLFDAYEKSTDAVRSKYHSLALTSFINALTGIVAVTPTVIILDTIESIENTKLLETLLSLLPRISGRCGFIFAGRNDLTFPSPVTKLSFKISGFLAPDIAQMARRMFLARGLAFNVESSVFPKLLIVTEGKPILCALAIDWLMENPDQTAYILEIKKDAFEREIILCLKALEKQEIDLIELMAIVIKGFDVPLASSLTGKSEEECRALFELLKRFSFIRVIPAEGQLALHDEIVRLIVENYAPQNTEVILATVVEKYRAKVGSNGCDKIKHKGYIADLLYYLMMSDRVAGIEYFDNQFQTALESFDYDMCMLLMNEANAFCDDVRVNVISGLCKAEWLIAQYKPMDAKILLEDLSSRMTDEFKSKYSARVMEGFGNIIVNPCTIVGADLFQAIKFFQQSYCIYEAKKDDARIAPCLMALGKAYVYLGRHDEAEKAFKDALAKSRARGNYKLSARILDEIGETYRLQQNIEKALPPLLESLALRKEHKDDNNMGILYFYLGNVYRDLDQFVKADECYNMAEECLLNTGDAFRLCELYCEMSWRRRLSAEYPEADELIERSWGLATRHEFGTEYSEYYHIKYEICMARGEIPRAYEHLDEALNYARKYSNIYILLDCLNHSAQRAYAQKNSNSVPGIINEMKRYEKMGCGIKVFTGRATMVLGDSKYDCKDYRSAFRYWEEGLTTIALYGNSRTNVELFGDIFESRVDKFRDVLRVLGDKARHSLIDHWKQHKLEDHFPQVMDVCALGSKAISYEN